MRRLGPWLRALLQRRRFERELDDELAFHLDARCSDLVARGLAPDEARRRARIELGMTQLHRDAVRQARGLAPVDAVARTLRVAWRSLWRTPGYTLGAMLVLGLPLAAIVMMYAMFATYALHVPPFEHAARWIHLEGIEADRQVAATFEPALARALVQEPPAQVEGLFTHAPVWERITTHAEFRGAGAAVSDNFFALAGLPFALGRSWYGHDDARDADTVILTESGWHKLFDRAGDVVGRRLDIGARTYTVAGVVGRGFTGLLEVGTLYYLRDQDRPRIAPDAPDAWPEVGGFLRPQAGIGELNLALAARNARLGEAQHADARLDAIQAVTRRGILREADRKEAMLAGAPIGLVVLLILAAAAANLANLVLARFAARRQDLAVRAAIGAGRSGLFLHLLAECLLLGLLAGALALVLVLLLMQPVHGFVFGLLAEAGLDILPLAFGPGAALLAFALSVFAALCFGALPAWWESGQGATTRSGAGAAAGAATRRGAPRRLRAVLMGLQLATSVFLVVVAGLVAANARGVEQARLGFDPAALVALRAGADAGATARALARLDAVAGIAATSEVPFVHAMPRADAVLPGRTERVHVRYVDAAWWTLLGLAPRAGRAFHAGEGAGSTAAVVSARAAALLWPGRSPLGEALRLRAGERDTLALDRRVEVVGVVDDLATGWLLGEASRAVIYLPAAAGGAEAPVLLLRLRDATPAGLVELQRACQRLAPATPSCEPLRLTDALRTQRMPFAIASTLANALAWLALGISCVGLHGLVSHAVVQQRRALGVRLALGARERDVIAHVMRGAVVPLAWGLCAGLGLAWGASRLLAHLTDYLRSFALDAFVLYPAVLVGFALLAAWLPARGSTRVPVTVCLRDH